MARQKAICILGMHRSGTSAIARALNLLGAYIGREDQWMPPKEDNPDGFWEHMDIYSFHERLLNFLFHPWDSVSPMPEEWWKKPEVEPYRKELIDLIQREFEGQPLWMWKDPRTSLLLPLWREMLQKLDIDISYVICIRNPLDVAASLKRRNDFSKSKSLTLWYLYNVSSCYWTEGQRRTVIHYDSFLEDWEPSLKKIAASSDIPWPENDSSLKLAMTHFLKLTSRHSRSDFESLISDPEIPEKIVFFYRLLLATEKDPNLLYSKKFEEYAADFYDTYPSFLDKEIDAHPGVRALISSAPFHSSRDTESQSGPLRLDEIESLRFSFLGKPRVSIVIPVWNHWQHTYRCLRSVLENTEGVAYEVVIVDNGSTDKTIEMLKKVENVRMLRNGSNLGFAVACNQGAREAQGDHLLFLNNDARVTKGWLKAMVSLIDSDERIGVVGAKLIYPDGRLQEAGGMIFSDGRGWNFGNGDDPEKEIYNQIGEVDYCSGACLLVRKNLFNTLSGFDERYSPAYYEETDLCFASRKMGYKVLYNPKAVVIHYESVTAGKGPSLDFKKYLEDNRNKFVEKWNDVLTDQDEHPNRTGELPRTASRERLSRPVRAPKAKATYSEPVKKKGLIFFPQNPYPAKTGAHKRCLAMLQGLRKLGYELTLFSYNSSGYPWEEESLRYLHDETGIEVVIYEVTQADQRFIHSMSGINTGVVNWNVFTPPGMAESFCRLFIQLNPHLTLINYAYWAGLAQGEEFNCVLKMIDSHDLVTLSTRMWQLVGDCLKDPPFSPHTVAASLLEEDFYKRDDLEPTPDEYQIYDQFDYTIAVSGLEARAIREHTSYTRVLKIPITSHPVNLNNSYGEPPVFIMGDNPFNIQGYLFLVAKILPTVRSRLPSFKVTVAGEATHKLLPAEGVQLLGYVPDLTSLYANSMFALCPVMGGTGMPVKVIEAMAHGVPVIALRNAGQEIPIEHGETGFIAENALEFADYMLRLHSDRPLCRKMGEAARETIARRFSEEVLLDKLSEITLGRPNRFRQRSVPNISVSQSSISEYVGQLRTLTEKKDVYIDSLSKALHAKEQDLLTLRETVGAMIKEKDEYVESLVQTLKDKEEYILNLTTLISEQNSIKKKRAYRLLKRLRFV